MNSSRFAATGGANRPTRSSHARTSSWPRPSAWRSSAALTRLSLSRRRGAARATVVSAAARAAAGSEAMGRPARS